MKKVIILVLTLVSALSLSTLSIAQTPSGYELKVKNDVLISSTEMQFDIYLRNTDPSVDFYYGNCQYAILYNGLISDGTITASLVSGSSQLTNTAQIPTSISIAGDTLIRIAAKTGQGSSSAIISRTGDGTRIITVRLVSTTPWNAETADLTWRDVTSPNSGTGLITKIFAYNVSTFSSSVEISDTDGSSNVEETTNSTLPVELSSFVAKVVKNEVILDWSTSKEVNNAKFEIERMKVTGENGSQVWSKVSEVEGKGNSETVVNYSYRDSKLASGTYEYRLKQVDVNGNYEYHKLSSEVIVGVPTEFRMDQNYPNPFNPVTKIAFSLPVDSRVSLRVYDITGKLVSTLINNEVKSADYYELSFDGSKLSSGVYFYRIETVGMDGSKSIVDTKRMALVK